MKLLRFAFFAFFGGAVAASQVAVRTTFDASDPNKCTEEEFDIALGGIMKRQLRTRRELFWYCPYVCRDIRKGYCKLVYTACVGYRRMEEEQESIPSDHSPSASSALPTARHLDQDTMDECLLKMKDVDAAYDNAVESMTGLLSSRCINTLKSPRHHVCIELLGASPDDSVDSVAVIDANFAKVEVKNNVYFGQDCSDEANKIVAGESSTEITFCFTVCNKGDTFLDQFLIRNDGLNFEDAGSIGRLAPRSCMTVSLPSTIGLEDSKNQVTVTARPIDENGNALAYHAQLVTANAESTIKVRKMKAD